MFHLFHYNDDNDHHYRGKTTNVIKNNSQTFILILTKTLYKYNFISC